MITGKALPDIKDELPPSQAEIDELSRLWDATVPQYYKSLLDAGKLESRFDFNKAKGVYIHRKTGRVLDAKEVKRVFLLFTKGMKV
jgi:hypothetical protein